MLTVYVTWVECFHVFLSTSEDLKYVFCLVVFEMIMIFLPMTNLCFSSCVTLVQIVNEVKSCTLIDS